MSEPILVLSILRCQEVTVQQVVVVEIGGVAIEVAIDITLEEGEAEEAMQQVLRERKQLRTTPMHRVELVVRQVVLQIKER